MNQKGAIPALVLFAAIGLIIFLVIAGTFSFKKSLFSGLFPKPSSFASEKEVTFIDDEGKEIPNTISPTVRVKLWAPWEVWPTSTTVSAPISEELFTKQVVLSENLDFHNDPALPNDYKIYNYKQCVGLAENCVRDGYFLTRFTFSDTSFGRKILYVKFIGSNLSGTKDGSRNTFGAIELKDPNPPEELVGEPIPEPFDETPPDDPIDFEDPDPTDPGFTPEPTEDPFFFLDDSSPEPTESDFEPFNNPTPTPRKTTHPTSQPAPFLNKPEAIILDQAPETPDQFNRPEESPKPGVTVVSVVTNNIKTFFKNFWVVLFGLIPK